MVDTTPPQTSLTPAQKAELRTGRCVALVCKERCETFEYVATRDGFKTCVCGHTQHAHAMGEDGFAR